MARARDRSRWVMPGRGRLEAAALWVLALVWAAFWFWAFSLAYSDSFFDYNRNSRVPVFVAALLGAVLIFASAARQWRSRRSPVAASVRHALGVVLSVSPLLATSALLHHAPPPWRPSADDAMGTGIDFLLLVGAGLASLVVLAGGLALRGWWSRRSR